MSLKYWFKKSMDVCYLLSDTELWDWALDGGLHNLWYSNITTVHQEWWASEFVLGLHQHAEYK